MPKQRELIALFIILLRLTALAVCLDRARCKVMLEIFKEFTFAATHHLTANVNAGHPYASLPDPDARQPRHLRHGCIFSGRER